MKKTHKMNIVVFKLVHRTFELQALDTCVAALSSADMVRRIYVPSSDGPRAPASASSSTLAPTAEPTSSPPSSSNSSLAPTAETKPSPPPTFLPTPGQCGNVSSYTNARFFLFLSLLLTDRDRKRERGTDRQRDRKRETDRQRDGKTETEREIFLFLCSVLLLQLFLFFFFLCHLSLSPPVRLVLLINNFLRRQTQTVFTVRSAHHTRPSSLSRALQLLR